ncbi:MAG: T9SS type A sorting domain-containing protein [Prolixibacteraceae bacterium]|nr:T9SS type A sorting domain-containing protein [Prolixibacteraceae bacterium]
MKYLIFTLLLVNTLWLSVPGQTCGVAQALTALQQAQLSKLINPLDTALKREDLFHIDSLSTELKGIYSTEGGRPDALESYYNLTSKTNWLNVADAVLLSRALIAADSMVYVNLWKAGKGMKPPLYQPNSLFLRASAEIASGLLKIADKETNLTRKAAYQSWATRALDSLATMQLPSGAFPFPDLRTYGDPVFKSIIQNFLNRCGADSVKVLKSGWIVDDKGSGEFKFDAGVIANAYYEAYLYTGKTKYKNIAIAVGNFLKPLKFNTNYNYNTFVSLGLTRAFQLTNDPTYLSRAIVNLRYAVYPGQITNGRWMDGHNANSRYHSIIIQNIVPTIQLIQATNSYKNALEPMTLKAVKSLVDYTTNCGSATGYRWLLKAYGLNSMLLPATVKNSVTDLIGQHINQSATNGKYLDIPTMGEYMELLGSPLSSTDLTNPEGVEVRTFPNPTNGITNIAFTFATTENVVLSVFDVTGRLVKMVDEGKKASGVYTYQIDLSQEQAGVYFLILKTTKQKYTSKIIRTK